MASRPSWTDITSLAVAGRSARVSPLLCHACCRVFLCLLAVSKNKIQQTSTQQLATCIGFSATVDWPWLLGDWRLATQLLRPPQNRLGRSTARSGYIHRLASAAAPFGEWPASVVSLVVLAGVVAICVVSNGPRPSRDVGPSGPSRRRPRRCGGQVTASTLTHAQIQRTEDSAIGHNLATGDVHPTIHDTTS